MGVDLILGADSIAAPLTGVGRYAYELARGLPEHPGIGRMRFFSRGRWLGRESLLGAERVVPDGRPDLRSTLAASRLAVRAYGVLMPALERLRLRGQSDALFHSPNFFLPPFAGRSVTTVHDLSHHIHPHFHPPARIDYMRRMLPDSLRRATHVITVSESARRDLVTHLGYPPERVTATLLGVNPQFRPREKAELEPVLQRLELKPHSYSLYVGTVEPRKNLDRLLDAYAALPEQLRRHHPLVMAGSPGWNSEHTHARMQQAASAGWLRYLRYVPQADLPALYAGALLFVYPSLYEGFGLPVLEAMASGTPVVTSHASSLPEVAGDAALLFEPHDSAALAEVLARALQDRQWRELARRAGLVRASQFSWARCIQATVQVYERVACGPA
ncbi:glycosyltransferase family 1 protein [Melaminivora suipulveris]|uniref:Glycosyltransferase family 1 protein n=1 Tax=Melaminivora suipulveris TaxID=2109913 RepID=A0A2R3QA43_9BURK|nr:glycosyltransferase family 1 protein [Melaminivora suipulveris]AVO48662.1 glycosyltransferase family 1 protein [Melaminivora suipulveris]